MLRVTSPGRICLFGEHQDYLSLPVIACAISLRVSIEGSRRDDRQVSLNLPDIGKNIGFSLAGELTYLEDRDYFRSAVNVLLRDGFSFSNGFDCTVHGNIPISAGTSSSSALTAAWVKFLVHMSDGARALPAEALAEYVYRAEVLEFSEPGGMMDQYATALGGVVLIESHPQIRVSRLPVKMGSIVLGDSLEPKDTMSILSRVKRQVFEVCDLVKRKYPAFSLRGAMAGELDAIAPVLNDEQSQLLRATVRNHEITREAAEVLAVQPLDHSRLGALLNEHQQILRDVLRISTPKIDRMIAAALAAGAAGAKINGSGGGGCMFAYTADCPEEIARAITKAGGKPYIVQVDDGTRVESTRWAEG